LRNVINAYYHKFEAQHIREEEVGDGKGEFKEIEKKRNENFRTVLSKAQSGRMRRRGR
jgi:hypothetical protein